MSTGAATGAAGAATGAFFQGWALISVMKADALPLVIAPASKQNCAFLVAADSSLVPNRDLRKLIWASVAGAVGSLMVIVVAMAATPSLLVDKTILARRCSCCQVLSYQSVRAL